MSLNETPNQPAIISHLLNAPADDSASDRIRYRYLIAVQTLLAEGVYSG